MVDLRFIARRSAERRRTGAAAGAAITARSDWSVASTMRHLVAVQAPPA